MRGRDFRRGGTASHRLLCAPFAVLLVMAFPMVSTASPPSGLVSWWQAEGNANDSADSNTGALENGATFGPGHPGQAFSVDNTLNQFVSVPDANNLDNMTSITVAAWIFVTSTLTPQHILGKRDGICGPSDTITYQMFLQVDPGTSNDVVSFGGMPGSGAGGGNVPMNTWTHVAGTYDASTLTWSMYVNGVLVGTHVTPMGVGPTTPAPFKIGTSGTCQGFGGRIDEVQIYNRALSSAEIQSLMADSTSSVVTCSPNTVTAGGSTTCTATVTDTEPSGQTAPTGKVSFTSSGPGAFSPGIACTLAPASSSSASCSVTYTPSANASAVRSDSITANYNGDSAHATSSGSTNVTVLSLPSSTEQCKDGSWQNFVVFKNQGDCVSFVATGNKNPPGV